MMSTEEIVLDEKMEMDEDEETCFMCNQNIIGKSYFSSQSQENSDMLCHIFKIQHLGEDYNKKLKLSFEKINYCRSCVDKIRIVHDMLIEFERLEKQISEEMNSIESQIKINYDYYYDSKGQSNLNIKRINSAQQFRVAIINGSNFIHSKTIQRSLEKKKNINQKLISGRRETIVPSKTCGGLPFNKNSTKNITGIHINQSFSNDKANYNECPVSFTEQYPVIKLEGIESEYVSCQSPYSADNSFEVEKDPLAETISTVNSATPHNNMNDRAVQEGLHISIKLNKPKKMKAKPDASHVRKSQASSTGKTFICGACNESFDDGSKLEKHGHSHTTQEISPHNRFRPRILRSCVRSRPSPSTSTNVIEKALNAMKVAKILEPILPEIMKKYEGTYKCQYCTQTFMTPSHVKIHERQHTGEIPNYPCKYCDKIFTVRREFIRHRPTHTPEDKGYKCRHCENICKNKADLKIHERVVHNVQRERDIMCGQCGKTFWDVYGLRSHERTHTGEKPFVCQFCGQNFRNKTTLRNHERIHTGEKPFKCHYCEKHFRIANNRTKHERTIHMGVKPYMCQYCEKLFASWADWKRHELTHTQERPKACRCCGKKFPTNTDVKVHMRTHPGEKPYKCQYCELQFNYWRIVKEHERCSHPDMALTT